MKPYILSIDAGTTGITVLILNKEAAIIKKYSKEFTQYYPQPGWVEHDGEEIWDVTLHLIQSACQDYSPEDCAAIGITNQRETTMIWDRKTGKPIYNAIVWQCRRTQNICQGLNDAGYEELFNNKTGLVIDSYFSGTKIKCLLKAIELDNNNSKCWNSLGHELAKDEKPFPFYVSANMPNAKKHNEKLIKKYKKMNPHI